METFDFDLRTALFDLARVLIAFGLAVPIAWERMKSPRNMGLRTFPIVAIASCGFVLIARSMPGLDAEGLARVLQGLMGGIGFIGGGAILKEGADVRGIATAASIWSTGAIGAAVGLDRIEIAFTLSVINFLLLFFLTPLADGIRNSD